MKKVLKKEVIGIQPVFSTNVEKTKNYISDGNIINKNCVIDCGYTGECHINLTNVGNTNTTICAGDKIVQGILIPVAFNMPEEMKDETELYGNVASARGSGGFGSSGSR